MNSFNIGRNYRTKKLYRKQFMSSIQDVPTEVESMNVLTRGCVLVSQPEEYSHFFTKAVILIFEYGKGETQGNAS